MSLVLAAWALAALGFTLFAWVRLQPLAPEAPFDCPVLLLRPVESPTQRELENLSAPLPVGVRQVVLSPFALPVKVVGEWLHSDPPTANRKAGHLVYALTTLSPEGAVVVVADADVQVDEPLLRALVGPVLQGAALVTAEPRAVGAPSLGAAALRGLLNHTHQNFRAVDAVSVGAKPVCGKAMALGPAALRELSGLTGCIGEDLELSVRLHAAGEWVALASAPAHMPQAAVSLRASLLRTTRWMQVLKAHRPALGPFVPALFACTPVLVTLAFLSQAPLLQGVVAALVAVRTGFALALTKKPSGAWEWALGEVLLLGAYVAALGRRTVQWRGRRFDVLPGGAIRTLVRSEAST